jgi:ABC-2 type transport system permease protein
MIHDYFAKLALYVYFYYSPLAVRVALFQQTFLAGFGFSALAIAMAARTKQTQTYGILSQTITLPLSFLGGAFVPVSSLPAILYPITVVNPVTYAVNAVRDVMLKGYLPVMAFFEYSAVLIAFALVTLAIAAVLFKGANE